MFKGRQDSHFVTVINMMMMIMMNELMDMYVDGNHDENGFSWSMGIL